jgi:DNA-binding response OmpR family regulator
MPNRSILLLISDSLVRSVIGETLERAGYLIFPTGDLGSAVDWLKRGSPDLLITRPFVSGMTGHEAAKYLRGKKPGLRVLILGGFLDDHRLEFRESLAGFDIFPKPFTGAELVEKVEEVLNKKRPPTR